MSDCSDDEYAPIKIATWGSQASTQPDNEEGTSKGWNSLLDPNVKVGANGVGSGQLHRKGTNFKPVGEDLILAQRLNKPVSKKQMQSAVREVETNLGLPPSKNKSPRSNKKKPPVDNNDTRKFSHRTSNSSTTNNQQQQQQQKPNSHFDVPTTTRVPVRTNSSDNDGSKWLQTSLVDTPFWTEKKNMPPTPVTSSPAQPAIPPIYTRPSTAVTNGRSNMTKPKVDNVWIKNVDNKDDKEEWAALSKDVETLASTGWDSDTNDDKPKTLPTNVTKDVQKTTQLWGEPAPDSDWNGPEWASDSKDLGWESTSVANGGWGQPTNHNNNNNNNNNTNAIPSSEPSWIHPTPYKDNLPKSPPLGNRFSNPSKQRYSSTIPMNVPKPINYRPQSSQPSQLATAPPPPPENNLLVTIKVELAADNKIDVNIHELDEPSKLAQDFAVKYEIQSEKIIFALTDLFSKQKSLALKKKQHKLQRRVFNPSSQTKYYQKDNVYTNSSYQQTPLLPSPPPFARKAYY